jgi:hypothetical protein
MRLHLLLRFVMFWTAVSAVWGQTSGNITGKIVDATGAVLRGATVKARNAETGNTREVVTNELGVYAFPVLPVGSYEIRAEAPGFKSITRKGVTLVVAQTAVVDFAMEVGAANQEITVVSEAPLVNTATSELSYLVGEKSMRDLPLNGRNYTDLALLQPGVVAYPLRDGGSVVAHGLGTSINGQDPRSNQYLLDGTPMNDFTNGPAGSAAGTVLGLDTIREFRVETNAYSAEYGRTYGGQIAVVSKSGSNALHGSVFEYFRNDNFDARNFFDGKEIPKFTRNQFGGTLGGPIKRDKTFFFGGYEALRERLGKTISSFVPDDNARRGLVPSRTNPGQIVQVQIDPAVQPYLNEIPRATIPNSPGGGFGTYVFGFNQTVEQDYAQGRVDHYINAKQQIFGRYTFDTVNQRLPTDFPQFPRDFLSQNHFATIEHRAILSPSILNTVRLSYARTRIGQNVFANTSQPLTPFVKGRDIMGNFDIGGMPRFGPQSSADLRVTQNLYGVEDNLSITRGRHLMKAGVLVERYQDNLFNPTFSLGTYTFNDLQAFLQNQASRFLGLSGTAALDRYWRFTLLGLYFQDDFRVLPRLTLNIGLRYEYATMPRDIYGRDSALKNIYTDAAPQTGQLYDNPNGKNFSPRFGFAWDVFGTGKTSVRGGYGWFFNTNNQQNLIVTITNPPATPRYSITNPKFPEANFEAGVGNTIRPVEWNIKLPNIHVWNFNIQQQLPWDSVLTVGYAGSRGIHLLRSIDINTPVPTQRADGTYVYPTANIRPNPNYTVIELKKSDGNSWYNAALFDIRKRFSKGLMVQSSYTFSRNIDTTQASTFFSDATNGTTSAMPELPGFNYNKGLSDYHAKHNWVFNATYQFPKARFWLIDGWQSAAIATMRSGNPVTLFVQSNISRSRWQPSLGPGIGFDRVSMAPGFTHQSAVIGSPDGWFNPAAFVLPEAGTLGNLGRGALIGPNLRTLDFSLAKNNRVKRLGEAGNVQFRAEAFNLLNRPNFALNPPGLLAFSGTAGNRTLSSFGLVRPPTVTSARQIQLSLRVSF